MDPTISLLLAGVLYALWRQQQELPLWPSEWALPAFPSLPSLPGLSSGSAATTAAQKVVENSHQYLGQAYVWAGESPGSFDCSGFVTYLYRQQGIELPHNAAAQYNATTRVDNPVPGDLVFFSARENLDHVGIVLGGGQFIQAGGSRSDVNIDTLANWSGLIAGYGRVG